MEGCGGLGGMGTGGWERRIEAAARQGAACHTAVSYSVPGTRRRCRGNVGYVARYGNNRSSDCTAGASSHSCSQPTPFISRATHSPTKPGLSHTWNNGLRRFLTWQTGEMEMQVTGRRKERV